MKISRIFEDEPEQWGLCGNPYLWRELKERPSIVEMPETPEQLKAIVEQATGQSINYMKFSR